MSARVRKADLFATLPPLPPPGPGGLAAAMAELNETTVVLDDDPTGTQTVHDVPVLTEWSVPALAAEFEGRPRCFFVLTNSRSLAPEAAAELNRQAATHLLAAAGETGRAFHVISRGDSTLRGHFPDETDALNQVLGPFAATLIIPYFEAGGRYTIEDVHYVSDGEWLVPAAETPFARDPAFGYRRSNLREWVAEKTGGRVRASEVSSISIAELRDPDTRSLDAHLRSLERGRVCIVNAAAPEDLESLVRALFFVGFSPSAPRFLFRTSAQFVAAWTGRRPRPLLTGFDLFGGEQQPATSQREYSGPAVIRPRPEPYRARALEGVVDPDPERGGDREPSGPGGLIVVGSHVPTTTEQLNCLFAEISPARFELSVPEILSERCERLLNSVLTQTTRRLAAGADVVLFTSRERVAGTGTVSSLTLGNQVSDALVGLVRRLAIRPRYVLAKGGITSSDLATRGLGVRRARVLGQLLRGVPVWELGPETRFPGLPLVIFPGNVGGPDALVQAVRQLRRPVKIGQ